MILNEFFEEERDPESPFVSSKCWNDIEKYTHIGAAQCLFCSWNGWRKQILEVIFYYINYKNISISQTLLKKLYQRSLNQLSVLLLDCLFYISFIILLLLHYFKTLWIQNLSYLTTICKNWSFLEHSVLCQNKIWTEQ